MISVGCLPKPLQNLARQYSTAPFKLNLKLVARVRKEIEGIPLSKAKDALIASNNNFDAALKWLEENAAKSGIKKAQKVSARIAKEGLVGVVVGTNGNGGAIVEVNSETDFAARNSIFQSLVMQTASSVYLLHSASQAATPISFSTVLNTPLLPHASSTSPNLSTKTIQESIIETIGKLGENLSCRRCAIAPSLETPTANETIITGSYVHGESELTQKGLGKIGALASLRVNSPQSKIPLVVLSSLSKLSKQLSQIVVGFSPVTKSDLLKSPFMFSLEEFAGETLVVEGEKNVEKVLNAVGKGLGAKVEVIGYERYEVGEGIEKEANNFANEVKKQLAQ